MEAFAVSTDHRHIPWRSLRRKAFEASDFVGVNVIPNHDTRSFPAPTTRIVSRKPRVHKVPRTHPFTFIEHLHCFGTYRYSEMVYPSLALRCRLSIRPKIFLQSATLDLQAYFPPTRGLARKSASIHTFLFCSNTRKTFCV